MRCRAFVLRVVGSSRARARKYTPKVKKKNVFFSPLRSVDIILQVQVPCHPSSVFGGIGMWEWILDGHVPMRQRTSDDPHYGAICANRPCIQNHSNNLLTAPLSRPGACWTTGSMSSSRGGQSALVMFDGKQMVNLRRLR